MQGKISGPAFDENAQSFGAFWALAFEWGKRANQAITTPAEFVEWLTKEDGTGATDAQVALLYRRQLKYAFRHGTPNQFTGMVTNWQGENVDSGGNGTGVDPTDDNRSL